MTANPPHVPAPGEPQPAGATRRGGDGDRSALAGGLAGIGAVALAVLALAAAAALIAAVVAWVG